VEKEALAKEKEKQKTDMTNQLKANEIERTSLAQQLNDANNQIKTLHQQIDGQLLKHIQDLYIPLFFSIKICFICFFLISSHNRA
jgi:phosphoglycerate-specific signal transduction histidine kinase